MSTITRPSNALLVHAWVLPRWFGLPVALAAVALGGVMSGASAFDLFLSCLIAALLMAWAHSSNAWIDYVVTGFDRGTPAERSEKKPYTSGQNVIEEGTSTWAVAANALFWLALALLITALASTKYGPTVWLPVLLTAPLTFAYSLGKKYWLCETVLFFGFGPLAGMLGAAVSQDPQMLQAALATIPIGLIFGFAAEAYDQWYDAEHNWDRGLRNLGALAWKRGWDIQQVVGGLFIGTIAVHGILVLTGVLPSITLVGLLPAFFAGNMIRDGGLAQKHRGTVLGVMALMFAYCALQVLAIALWR